jgi:beta-galactosidase
MSFKSGFTNEYSTVRWERAPGPLREAAGFFYQEFSNLTQPLRLKGDPFTVGDSNRVSVWAEFLIPETAKVLAMYDDPFLGRFPAITHNSFGEGTLTYEGTFLTMPLQQAVLKRVLESASISSPDQDLPKSVRVKHAQSKDGKTVHFYFNYSGRKQFFEYPYQVGVDLLTEKAVKTGALTELDPWDLVVIFEDQIASWK